MQPRYNLAHMFLAAVIAFGLTLLVTVVMYRRRLFSRLIGMVTGKST